MSSPAAAINEAPPRAAPASAIEIFCERCEARCLLVSNGLMDLQTAVDELQEVAVSQRLVAKFGQDAIQQIMGESFGRWRLE